MITEYDLIVDNMEHVNDDGTLENENNCFDAEEKISLGVEMISGTATFVTGILSLVTDIAMGIDDFDDLTDAIQTVDSLTESSSLFTDVKNIFLCYVFKNIDLESYISDDLKHWISEYKTIMDDIDERVDENMTLDNMESFGDDLALGSEISFIEGMFGTYMLGFVNDFTRDLGFNSTITRKIRRNLNISVAEIESVEDLTEVVKATMLSMNIFDSIGTGFLAKDQAINLSTLDFLSYFGDVYFEVYKVIDEDLGQIDFDNITIADLEKTRLLFLMNEAMQFDVKLLKSKLLNELVFEKVFFEARHNNYGVFNKGHNYLHVREVLESPHVIETDIPYSIAHENPTTHAVTNSTRVGKVIAHGEVIEVRNDLYFGGTKKETESISDFLENVLTINFEELEEYITFDYKWLIENIMRCYVDNYNNDKTDLVLREYEFESTGLVERIVDLGAGDTLKGYAVFNQLVRDLFDWHDEPRDDFENKPIFVKYLGGDYVSDIEENYLDIRRFGFKVFDIAVSADEDREFLRTHFDGVLNRLPVGSAHSEQMYDPLKVYIFNYILANETFADIQHIALNRDDNFITILDNFKEDLKEDITELINRIF